MVAIMSAVIGITLYVRTVPAIRNHPYVQALGSRIWSLSEYFPWIEVPLTVRLGILAAWVTIIGILILAWTERRVLKLLLTSKSWLYQARKPTIWVTLWYAIVRLFTKGKPLTYSFESSLPKLPVPVLKDTVEKYLANAKLLQSDEEFRRTEEAANTFLAKEGPKLQRYLQIKSWIAPNYVTDWWEQFVYLRGRSPLAVNSNYYILDSGRTCPTNIQEARAGFLLHSFMKFKEELENETIPPVMIGDGSVPLDMWQYERMFATSRIPGRDMDENKHWDSSLIRHIVVHCKGSIYRLNVYRTDGSLRPPDELEQALAAIKRDANNRKPRESEILFPCVTADNRTRWAEIRETYFSEGVNRRSLDTIERALLWLSLDDQSTEMLDWSGRGKALLAGNPKAPNIWFDKSINMIVFPNGKAGLNCEHSWADAPVAAHLMEQTFIVGEYKMNPYDETGHVKAGLDGSTSFCNRPPEREEAWNRLSWALSADAEDAIRSSYNNYQGLINDIDLSVTSYSNYGKDFVKKCRVSPDAYVQMAMQLAYFRDRGRFDATYESSMTRLFLHGRTETVRPVTSESCAFVRAMEDPQASPRDKLRALQVAAERHVRGYTDAMAGAGIDRHLFALYCVSVGTKTESPFLKIAMSSPWKLSTSQQPQQQTTLWDIKDPIWANRISPGGGFGPVCDDGYGVSYMVSGEREFFFHVSALRKSAPTTDVARFRQKIFGALDEMKQILSLALTEEANAAKNTGKIEGNKKSNEGSSLPPENHQPTKPVDSTGGAPNEGKKTI